MEDFFSVPITFFKIIGLTPYDAGSSVKNAEYRRVLFWFSLVDLGLALVFQAAYFIQGMQETDNFLQMISAAACIAFGAMAWEEMLMIWLNRNKLLCLIDFLKSRYPETPTLQSQFGMTKLYKETRTFMISFAVCYLILIFAFNFTPLIASFVNFYSGLSSDWTLGLPYLMLFPFDPKVPLTRYVFVYVLESWAGFTAVVSCLAMNLFLGSMITQLCLHLKIMRVQLRAVDLRQRNQLRTIVIKHCELIKCCQDLEETFSTSLFVNYMCSSLLICFVGFQVVVGTNYFEIIKFCLFLISSLLQTLSLSHFGQAIIDNVSTVDDLGKCDFNPMFFRALPYHPPFIIRIGLKRM